MTGMCDNWRQSASPAAVLMVIEGEPFRLCEPCAQHVGPDDSVFEHLEPLPERPEP